MSKIRDWFISRKEHKVREMVIQHTKLVIETIESFGKFTELFLKDRKTNFALFERVSVKEHEADIIRRKILDQLSDTNLLPAYRENLARVVRQSDWIADWALEAVRLISTLKPESLSDKLWNLLSPMVQKVIETALETQKCLESMFEDMQVALDYCDKVERYEEDVDRLYQEFRQNFAELCEGMSYPECILLFHTVDAIENIADRCEDTCDRVREFLVMKV
ncbi:MAG: hypothetical protein B6U94_04255 [Thermofilum sp. ex4484_79]|nr:MAG: hypothetical protein B6U94_04255 [Thermofilum sp. ex4484_79]